MTLVYQSMRWTQHSQAILQGLRTDYGLFQFYPQVELILMFSKTCLTKKCGPLVLSNLQKSWTTVAFYAMSKFDTPAIARLPNSSQYNWNSSTVPPLLLKTWLSILPHLWQQQLKSTAWNKLSSWRWPSGDTGKALWQASLTSYCSKMVRKNCKWRLKLGTIPVTVIDDLTMPETNKHYSMMYTCKISSHTTQHWPFGASGCIT